MSTVQDTFFGITHALTLDKLVADTNHPASMLILRQMIVFVHGALVKENLDAEGMKDRHDVLT